jgi:hypothetical protein
MNAAGTIGKAIVVTAGGVLATTSIALAAALTPAPIQPAVVYLPVDLGAQATYALSNIYVNPPTGAVKLGNVPFTAANTGWAVPGTQFSVAVNTHNTKSIHLLLNSSNAALSYKGLAVGKIHLTFSDASVQDTNLVVGGNVREWWTGSGFLVDTITDPNTTNVWQGAAQPGMAAGTAIIDMLSVNVKSTTANLTGVSFLNAAAAPYNLFTSGLTLAYQPAPIVIGGGNTNQVGNHNDNNNNQDINKVNPPIKNHDDAKLAPAAPKPVAPKVGGDQTQHQSTGVAQDRSSE